MGLLDVVVHRPKEEKLLCEKLILKTIAWAEDLWLNIHLTFACQKPQITSFLLFAFCLCQGQVLISVSGQWGRVS